VPVPIPTPIYRLIHVENLHICLRRAGLHAPNHTPDDGLAYKTIHNEDIQAKRQILRLPCGPRGVIHDYVSFYFGPRSPMLYQLHTGWLPSYQEGQEPLIYLVSTAQDVANSGSRFVFSNGHGIARFTDWFDSLDNLGEVDWNTVNARIWKDTEDDPDRQRRKQAEFLVHGFCDWEIIQDIGVLNSTMRDAVREIMGRFPRGLRRAVAIQRDWYY